MFLPTNACICGPTARNATRQLVKSLEIGIFPENLRIQSLISDLGSLDDNRFLLNGDSFSWYRSGQDHQQSSSVVFHSSLNRVMDNIHEVDPVLLILSRHTTIALVGNVVECL